MLICIDNKWCRSVSGYVGMEDKQSQTFNSDSLVYGKQSKLKKSKHAKPIYNFHENVKNYNNYHFYQGNYTLFSLKRLHTHICIMCQCL